MCTSFDNISQRVVFSYRRQLVEFAPVIPEHFSVDEQHEVQASQQALYDFMCALYECTYDQPELFGLPLAEDVFVSEGNDKEQKAAVTAKIKKPRAKMAYGIEFLYFVGQQGTLVDRHLQIDQKDYAPFFTKNPRVKAKLVKGMQEVGLIVAEQGDQVIVSSVQYPNMMLALKMLAEACQQRDDQKLSQFLFARCDFRVLDADYYPDALEMLRTILSSTEFEYAVKLDHILGEMGYAPISQIDGVFGWRVQYQGRRAVKASPLFEFEYDERHNHQLGMCVKCASTNRLVPLLAQQPESLQRDFFHHANNCGGASCGWCKTRKGMNPSALKYGGEKKTICWYMRRRFRQVDDQAIELIKQYVLLHEALAAA